MPSYFMAELRVHTNAHKRQFPSFTSIQKHRFAISRTPSIYGSSDSSHPISKPGQFFEGIPLVIAMAGTNNGANAATAPNTSSSSGRSNDDDNDDSSFAAGRSSAKRSVAAAQRDVTPDAHNSENHRDHEKLNHGARGDQRAGTGGPIHGQALSGLKPIIKPTQCARPNITNAVRIFRSRRVSCILTIYVHDWLTLCV